MIEQVAPSRLLSPGVTRVPFVDAPSSVLHLDVNSCFATIEQQCNPLLRGRPVAVAAYGSSRGCILSPSIEAKRHGVKTGMRVEEGQAKIPDLVVLTPNPWKYRWVNQRLVQLCRQYTPHFEVKSIDEIVLHLGAIAGERGIRDGRDPLVIGGEIKRRIRTEIGEWISVSVGVAPNRFLAKTAAGLRKPDGLEEINWWNIESVMAAMALEDLCGISTGNARRLRRQGVLTAGDLYGAPITALTRAFASILSLQWHLKLHGHEVDDRSFDRKSYSHMYSLPKPVWQPTELEAILSRLTHSVGYRMRKQGYGARSVFVALRYQNRSGWHGHRLLVRPAYLGADLQAAAAAITREQPMCLPIVKISVGVGDLSRTTTLQTTILGDELRKRRLSEAVDRIHATYGKGAIMPARILESGAVPDFVAFGSVSEMEEFGCAEEVTVETEDVAWTE